MEVSFWDKHKTSVYLEVIEKLDTGDEYDMVTIHRGGRKLPLGTMTIDFIETNFNDFASFQEYITNWGLGGFVAYSKSAKDVVSGGDLQKDEYDQIICKIYDEVNYEIILAQDEIKNIAYICLDQNGPDWSRGLTSKQRHYIMLEKQNKSMYEKRNHFIIDYYSDLTSKDLRQKIFYSKDLSESDLAKLIMKDNPVFVEVYGSDDIAALCLIEIKEMLANGIMVRKCKNCNRYFISGSKNRYCDRIVYYDSDGTPWTCQMIGPKKAFLGDPAKKEYSKAYRTLHNRKRLKKGGKYKVCDYELDFWRAKAKEKLEDLNKKIITPKEFSQWLTDTTKNFREWIKKSKEGK